MNRSTGRVLRLIGLAIEVSGLLVQARWTKTDQTGVPLPGHFSSRQVWIAVGIGFVLWLIGTLLIYWQPGKRERSGSGDLGELKL